MSKLKCVYIDAQEMSLSSGYEVSLANKHVDREPSLNGNIVYTKHESTCLAFEFLLGFPEDRQP